MFPLLWWMFTLGGAPGMCYLPPITGRHHRVRLSVASLIINSLKTGKDGRKTELSGADGEAGRIWVGCKWCRSIIITTKIGLQVDGIQEDSRISYQFSIWPHVWFTACLQSPEGLNTSALLEMFLLALRPQNDSNVSLAQIAQRPWSLGIHMRLKFQRSGDGLEHLPVELWGNCTQKWFDEDLKRKSSRMNLRQSLNLFDFNNRRWMYLPPTLSPPIEMRVLIMRWNLSPISFLWFTSSFCPRLHH